MAVVLTISGQAEHGKDTSAEFIKEMLEIRGKKVLILRYADYLKFICKEYFGWNGVKDEAGRTLLQQIGTNKIRAKDSNFWVSILEKLMSVFKDDYDIFIIPDARFPNEIEYLKNLGWLVVTLKVKRLIYMSSMTEKQKEHQSETALNGYTFDFEIKAENLYKLKKNCMEVSRWLKSFINLVHK